MTDLLSAVVTALKLRASSYYRAELHGDFALAIPRRPMRVRFHLALEGDLEVATPAAREPSVVRAGDVFLVTMGAPHTLMDQPGRTPIGLEEVKRAIGFKPGDRLRWGDGPHRATLVCGEFSGSTELFHPVFGALPTLVHAPVEDDDQLSTLADVLELVDRETVRATHGWMAIANRLSEIVMIRVLRAWMHRHPDALGALTLLRDPGLKRAIDAIHARPEQPWTVQDLAAAAGMSRTSFSTQFSRLMGVSPVQYLTSWRMEVARSLLHADELTLVEIAERVGYSSQAAFTKAFREVVGTTPGVYRSSAQALMGGR